MPPKGSPESVPNPESEFNPNMSIMSQALRIVAPSLIAVDSQEAAEQRIAEHSIEEYGAEEFRR